MTQRRTAIGLVVSVVRNVGAVFGADGQNAVICVLDVVLLVGIIASIKEIVVLSVKAVEAVGSGKPFSDRDRG